MPREARYDTAYPVSARQYYDLMLSSAFQRDVHVRGLGMRVWDNVDEYPRPRLLYRKAYSEPTLRLPKWMARFARKSQAYTEYSEFDPETLSRKTRVVPTLGANVMEFTVEERYVDREPSSKSKSKRGKRSERAASAGCVVISVVRIRCKLRLFRNLFERWILEQSEIKVAQRDAYVLNALKENAYDALLSRDVVEKARSRRDEAIDAQTLAPPRSFACTAAASSAIFIVRLLVARAGRRSR
jgi:hypothetical protein